MLRHIPTPRNWSHNQCQEWGRGDASLEELQKCLDDNDVPPDDSVPGAGGDQKGSPEEIAQVDSGLYVGHRRGMREDSGAAGEEAALHLEVACGLAREHTPFRNASRAGPVIVESQGRSFRQKPVSYLSTRQALQEPRISTLLQDLVDTPRSSSG